MKATSQILLAAAALLLAFAASAQNVPAIIVQPVSQSSAPGGTITFTVSASGAGTLAYQWQKNTTNMTNGSFSGRATVSGATTAALMLAGVTTNDQANYTCRVTNTYGSVTSAIATLAVIIPPVITTQPRSVNTNLGASVTFSVVATGTAPLAYQWYKDGASIPSATLNAYSISGVLAGDSGAYLVRVSNGAGSATSSNAFLNLGNPPTITADPTGLTVTQGQSATFTASATSDQPMNYYWRKNGANIPGANSTAYTIPSAVSSDAATYSLLASNLLGAATSAGAVLTVLVPATITVQPTSQVVGVGSNTTFTVTAAGTSPAYQWYKGGTNIAGATATSYSITSAQFSDSANYTVVVSNTVTSVTSQVATLTVQQFAPAITVQPVGGSQLVGSSFTFTVTATGTALVYQWQKSGVDVQGANGTRLTLNNLALTDAAAYTAIVTNPVGSVTSSPAVLYVGYAPVIVQQPISLTDAFGSTAVLTCTATGPLPMTYQWFQNATNLIGQTNATITLTNLQLQNVGNYEVIAANAFGSITSYTAVLHLSPGIVIQPTNEAVMLGSAASFSVLAGGEPPLTYQWQLNGTNLSDNGNVSGSANNVILLIAALTNTLGNYTVVVSNSYGSITSTAASLSVGYVSQSLFKYSGLLQPYVVPSGVTQLWVSITGGGGADGTGDTRGGGGTGGYASGMVSVAPFNTLTLSVGAGGNGTNGGLSPLPGYSGGNGSTWPGTSIVGGGGGAATIVIMPDGGSMICGGGGGGGGAVSMGYGGSGGSSVIVGVTNNQTAGGSGGLNSCGGGGGGSAAGSGGSGNDGGAGYAAGGGSNEGAGGGGAGGSFLPNKYLYGAGTWLFSNPGNANQNGSISIIANPIPCITQQPASQSGLAGWAVLFSVAVGSPVPLSYQWNKDGFAVPNATNAVFSLPAVTPQNAGNYSVVATNTFGSVTSRVVTLTVYIPVYITSQPQNQAVVQGSNAGFTVAATGTPTLGYQWYQQLETTATASPIVISGFVLGAAVISGGAGYTAVPDVEIVGGGGSGATAATVVSNGVVTAINIINPGSGYTNLPEIYIDPPSVPLDGQTNAVLTIENVTTNSEGGYFVVITNAFGAVTSSVATLSAYVPVYITAQPGSQTVPPGGNASFTVAATGTPPLRYQWFDIPATYWGASATASVLNGFVSAITVVNGGSG